MTSKFWAEALGDDCEERCWQLLCSLHTFSLAFCVHTQLLFIGPLREIVSQPWDEAIMDNLRPFATSSLIRRKLQIWVSESCNDAHARLPCFFSLGT